MTSDVHEELKAVIAASLPGANWQRCRAHWLRNALALAAKSAQQMVGATIRPVFTQLDARSTREQWKRVAGSFRDRFGLITELMDDAEADVLAYMAFPHAHWHQIWSNNPLERPH